MMSMRLDAIKQPCLKALHTVAVCFRHTKCLNVQTGRIIEFHIIESGAEELSSEGLLHALWNMHSAIELLCQQNMCWFAEGQHNIRLKLPDLLHKIRAAILEVRSQKFKTALWRV